MPRSIVRSRAAHQNGRRALPTTVQPPVSVAAVRDAAVADAAAMAEVQRDVWRTAYAEFLPPEVLEALTVSTATAAWERAVTAAGDAHLVVATENDEVTGFAAGAGAEVATLLVAPRWTRRGHGGRLLGTLAERLRANGAERAQVWVAEGDVAARGFFPRHGFRADGAVRTSHHGARVLRELRHIGSLEVGWR